MDDPDDSDLESLVFNEADKPRMLSVDHKPECSERTICARSQLGVM